MGDPLPPKGRILCMIPEYFLYLQHNDVMPKGNGFNELGIQPSLNAFSFFIQKSYIRELERKLCFH